MKKIITVAVIAATLLNTFITALAYDDVKNHWAAEYINSLTEKGVINGVSKNLFAPEGNVTRAEFLKIIMNVTKVKPSAVRVGECLELSGDEWYAQYVQGALDKGLIPKEMISEYRVEIIDDGTNSRAIYKGTFNGQMPITRQEMAVLTQHMYQYQLNAKTMQDVFEAQELKFADIASISDWALPSVEMAVAQGFIFGMDNGNFEPNSTTTRAQAAAIAFRVLGKVR